MLSCSRSARTVVASLVVVASAVVLAGRAQAANVPFTLEVATNGASCSARYVVTYQGQLVSNATIATDPAGSGCLVTGSVSSTSKTATTSDFTVGLAPVPLTYTIAKFGLAANTYLLYIGSGTGGCSGQVTVTQSGQPLSPSGNVSESAGPGNECTITVNTPAASTYPKGDFKAFVGGKQTDFGTTPV